MSLYMLYICYTPNRTHLASKSPCFYLFPFCELAPQSSHSPKLEFELIIDVTHFFNPHSRLSLCLVDP